MGGRGGNPIAKAPARSFPFPREQHTEHSIIQLIAKKQLQRNSAKTL